MEISVLQSLIDRTGREIVGYEEAVRFDLYNSHFPKDERMKSVSTFKKKIAKLVKIQKALKKEIKFQIELSVQMRKYAGFSYSNANTGAIHKIINGELVKGSK